MAKPKLDFIRQGLDLARERGFAEIELEYDGVKFAATLEPNAKQKPAASSSASGASGADMEPSDAGPAYQEITATLVGYFRQASNPLKVGDSVAKGQVVGSVSALGLANDVESKVEGEVMEVLVEDNMPVMYGQALYRVKA